MIIVKIYGGLGNQLFQYATARSIAIKLNRKLFIDDSWYKNFDLLEDYNKPNASTKREFLLQKFNIKSNILNTYHLNWIKRLRIRSKNNKFFTFLKKYPLNSLSFNIINQSNYSYDLVTNSTKIYLTGNWQNNDIIENHRKSLISEYKPKQSISEENNHYLMSISSSNSVALHFRRGDYVSKPLSRKVHTICSNDYYSEGIELLRRKTNNLQLFIFSDDIMWVKDNFDFKDNVTYISNEGPEFEHLYLMSQCKHQITANSTFSWWAAWLNNNPEKIVITPEYWYYDKKLNDTVIRIPKDWLKINNLI